MKHVYGPVPSRRLGRSLGVDTIPVKTCNFSCVYCQLGRTTTFINERRDFFARNEILREIKTRLALIREENIDFITFVGDGEPTLCRSLGWLLEQVHAVSSLPIAVITNGALLYREEVREELASADVVLPTLDAGTSETFRKINRPHPTIHFPEMIQGMIDFRKRYSGQIWMEFMAVRGINDTIEELIQIRKHLEPIKPDRLYVNIPIRPPAESWVKPPSNTGLARVRTIFTGLARVKTIFEIILPELGEFQIVSQNIEDLKQEIIQIIQRHPMHLKQIEELLNKAGIRTPSEFIEELEQKGLLKRLNYQNKVFFISGNLKMGMHKKS
ncbi:MAG: radical SAM protein [Candidatus Helarchaeota archaeon]